MSRAGQRNQSKGRQDTQSRAMQFGGGKGPGEIPDAVGCKLVYDITPPEGHYDLNRDEWVITVPCPQFLWDDGPSGGRAWKANDGIPSEMAVRRWQPSDPLHMQISDAFNKNMERHGWTRERSLVGDVIHEFTDEFGLQRFWEQHDPIQALSGGRNDYVGWRALKVVRASAAYDDQGNVIPGYWGIFGWEEDANEDVYLHRVPLRIPEVNGQAQEGRHEFWKNIRWIDNRIANYPSLKALGVFPGHGQRGLMSADKIRQDGNHNNYLAERRVGAGFSGSNFDASDSRIAERWLSIHGLTTDLDAGDNLRDQRTQEPLTEREWIYCTGGAGINGYDSNEEGELVFQTIWPGGASFDLLAALERDGYEFYGHESPQTSGANHIYSVARVKHVRQGSWFDKWRFLIVRWSRDQYGVFGGGGNAWIATAYAYSAIGADTEGALRLRAIAGK